MRRALPRAAHGTYWLVASHGSGLAPTYPGNLLSTVYKLTPVTPS